MKILAIFIVLAIRSTSFAQSTNNGRKQKPKLRREPLKNYHNEFPASLPRTVGKEFPGIRTKPRIPYVDEESEDPYFSKGGPGRHIDVDQRGLHVEKVQRDHHVEVDQPHNVGARQGRHAVVKQPGRHVEVKQRGPDAEVEQWSHHVGDENRGRQTRQSHNTFLTVQVPPIGSLFGGNQVVGDFQQDTSLLFAGGIGNHPGNTGGTPRPGIVTILHPGAANLNHGGGSGFRPEPSGSFGQNGNFPFLPGTSTGGSHGTSSAGGPGGLNSGADSGLAGGLGGAYGAGYGFGLGGLIFGGPNGPVFAGNAALYEGFAGNPDVDDVEDRDKQSTDGAQKERIPVFRPLPSRGSLSNGATRVTLNNQAYRGITDNPKKVQHPNNKGPPTLSTSSNGGETIGYVAFIFPKRTLQRQSANAARPSHNFATKSPNEAATTKTKSINQAVSVAATINNRPALSFVPIPVHIPVDRPYPVLVPKPYPVEVLKPYPVAVPVSEPVPYEVTRPIPVPLAVPAEATRPSQSPILIGVNGVGSAVLQPSIGTSILCKRSDTSNTAKSA